jgi:choline monooxygenase
MTPEEVLRRSVTAFSFTIDPDITRASTPPARVYSDADVYARARDLVFAPSWQLVADAASVRVPGQVFPFTMLEGCLDEPLLLTRDRGDLVHALSNVCTHRGNLVCEQGGIESGLRCRYHGRRFALDGSFQSMPEFEGVVGFPAEADSLPRVPLAHWGPLWFASLRPAVTFDDWIGPVRERVGWMPLADFRLDPTRSRDYLVAANWAVYCENYLEGFHIPYVHAGLERSIDYGSYTTELYQWSSLQLGPARGGELAFDLPRTSPDFGRPVAAYYFWLYPNLMFNFYPWGLSINVVKPLAVDRTRVSFLCYVGDADKLDRGAGSELDRIEREDEAIVEAVQKGVRSRLYDRGRYSPSREQGTHHFHRLLATALSPAD